MSHQSPTPGVRRVQSKAVGEIVIANTPHCAQARHLAGVHANDLVFTKLEVDLIRRLPERAIQCIAMVKREFPDADIIDVGNIEEGCFAALKDTPMSYPTRGQGVLGFLATED